MLVPAICPKCGGALEVDDSQEAAVCKYCSTPFIAEKAINNYINQHNTYINSATIVSKDTADRMFVKAIDLTKISKFQQAYDAFVEMSLEYPGDWRSWLGISLLRMHIKKSTALDIDPKVLSIFPKCILKLLNEPEAPLEYSEVKRLENGLVVAGRARDSSYQAKLKAENDLVMLEKQKGIFEKAMLFCFGGAGLGFIMFVLSIFFIKDHDMGVGLFLLSLIMMVILGISGMTCVAKVFSDSNSITKLKDNVISMDNIVNLNTQKYDQMQVNYNELKNKMNEKLARKNVNNVEDYYFYVLQLNPAMVENR